MKMLDEIQNNLELFDTEEPAAGHFDRFRDKLQKTPNMAKRKTLMILFRVAAVLIIGLFISTLIYKGVNYYRSHSDDSCPNQELCEAEDFYSHQVDTYYKQLKQLPFNNDSETRREVLNELKEMDFQVAGMKKDLRQNPDDERIIQSIINYYQEKIDFMNMIIMRTMESKSTTL